MKYPKDNVYIGKMYSVPRFAWFPKKIRGHWIWLEQYAEIYLYGWHKAARGYPDWLGWHKEEIIINDKSWFGESR